MGRDRKALGVTPPLTAPSHQRPIFSPDRFPDTDNSQFLRHPIQGGDWQERCAEIKCPETVKFSTALARLEPIRTIDRSTPKSWKDNNFTGGRCA